MSTEAKWGGHKMRRKQPEQRAIQWTGNGRVPDLKVFLAKLDCRILVDQGNFDLYLKWPNHTAHLPLGGWLLRSEAYDGSAAISYHKAEEFFDQFEYAEPMESKK
jgi:hypothetical protein